MQHVWSRRGRFTRALPRPRPHVSTALKISLRGCWNLSQESLCAAKMQLHWASANPRHGRAHHTTPALALDDLVPQKSGAMRPWQSLWIFKGQCGWAWGRTPFILAFLRQKQKQTDLLEFKANLVYKAGSRLARTIQWHFLKRGRGQCWHFKCITETDIESMPDCQIIMSDY